MSIFKINRLNKFILPIVIILIGCMVQSCYTTKYVNHYVNMADDFGEMYIGKSKSYIIEHFGYPPTDIKRFDENYEVLVFERARNYIVGNGITKFTIKNGVCVNVETNEYKNEPRYEKVPIF